MNTEDRQKLEAELRDCHWHYPCLYGVARWECFERIQEIKALLTAQLELSFPGGTE